MNDDFLSDYAATYAFETTLKSRGDDHGHFDWPLKAIAVNLGHTNSKVFDSVWRKECPSCSGNCSGTGMSYIKDGSGLLSGIQSICEQCHGAGYLEPYDLMITFCRRKDKLWNVSLYSTKPEIDCGAICKSFGGGGHRGAAGFQCKELPFEI